MKSNIEDFNIISAQTIEELKQSIDKGFQILAGGTDLMVLFESGKLQNKNYVSISELKELNKITVEKEIIKIGTLCTYKDIRNQNVIKEEFPMLVEAAKVTGSLAIQSRGTIGGNIINASPAADSPPALLCYDAKLEISNGSTSRVLEYKDFHTAYKKMDLNDGEFLTSIIIPRRSEKFLHYYHKVGTRAAQSISKVCFAGKLRIKDNKVEEVRLAFGSVAAFPLRARFLEDLLINKPLNQKQIDAVIKETRLKIHPMDDIRSTKKYRIDVLCNLLQYFLSTYVEMEK